MEPPMTRSIDRTSKNRHTFRRWAWVFGLMLTAMGCVTIPKAAPELSRQVGSRIGAIERSHLALLRSYMNEKRQAVDRFLYEEWLPVFAREAFKDPKIQPAWREITLSATSDTDRVKFIMILGPKLQRTITEKHDELHKPLDELQSFMESRIRDEYALTMEMNARVTSLLESAADLAEKEQSVLGRLGVSEDLNDLITSADDAVDKLLALKKRGENAYGDFSGYRTGLQETLDRLKKRTK